MVVKDMDGSMLEMIKGHTLKIANKVDELNLLVKEATDMDLLVMFRQFPERTGDDESVNNSLIEVDFSLLLRPEHYES